MGEESREVIIERLEQKLQEKDKELQDMRDELDGASMAERITGIEKKVSMLTNLTSGLVKEVLEQKKRLDDLEKFSARGESKPSILGWISRAKPAPSPPKVPQVDEKEAEYIIAESDYERARREEKERPKKKGGEIIIAGDEKKGN